LNYTRLLKASHIPKNMNWLYKFIT